MRQAYYVPDTEINTRAQRKDVLSVIWRSRPGHISVKPEKWV